MQALVRPTFGPLSRRRRTEPLYWAVDPNPRAGCAPAGLDPQRAPDAETDAASGDRRDRRTGGATVTGEADKERNHAGKRAAR